MLLPFDFAVITIAEAKLMMEFIEKQTATKGDSRNYSKMQKFGVLELYRSGERPKGARLHLAL